MNAAGTRNRGFGLAAALLVMGALAVISALGARKPAPPGPAQIVTVVSLQGDVRLNQQPLDPGFSGALPADAVFETGPETVMNLRMEDGSTLQLSQNSRLQVVKAETNQARTQFQSVMKLDAGEILRKIPKPGDGIERRNTLVTSSVTIGVRGTEFVASAGAGSARSMVIRGEVALEGSTGSSLALKENFGTVTEAGKPPQPPTPLPEPPTSSLPADGTHTTEAGVRFEWEAVPNAHGYFLELADDGDAFESVVVQHQSADPFAELKALPHDARYRWRVATVDARGLRGKGGAIRSIDYRHHHQRLRAQLRENDGRGALASAGAALAGFPSDPALQRDLGMAHLMAGDTPAARAALDRSLALEPSSADALAGLGQVDLAEAKLDDASRRFEAALALDPAQRHAHLGLARVEQARGNKAESHRRVDRHLELYPDDPQAQKLHQQVR